MPRSVFNVVPSRRLLGGLVLVVVLFLPWPGLGRGYARVVAMLAEAVLVPASPTVTLRFGVPAAGEGRVWRLDVHAEDAATGQFVETALDLRRAGYLASAVFTALVLATRMRRWRRLATLGAGLVALQVLPLLPVLAFFSGKLPVQVFVLGDLARTAVDVAYRALVAPPGMAYAVPAMLWLALVWLVEPIALRRTLGGGEPGDGHELRRSGRSRRPTGTGNSSSVLPFG